MERQQRLLEGEVIDDGDAAELDRLRGAVDRLTRERDALRTENADLRRRANDAALARLRAQLEPLYQALQGVFGELDEIAPEAVGTAAPGTSSPKHSAVWDAWKARLGETVAKGITALQVHGELNTQQLAIATGLNRNTITNAVIYKLNKAGLINKNGGPQAVSLTSPPRRRRKAKMSKTITDMAKGVNDLHKSLGTCHPKLARGMVWCKTCGRSRYVNSGDCLRTGWPVCCGETMTIDSPEERRAFEAQEGRRR